MAKGLFLMAEFITVASVEAFAPAAIALLTAHCELLMIWFFTES